MKNYGVEGELSAATAESQFSHAIRTFHSHSISTPETVPGSDSEHVCTFVLTFVRMAECQLFPLVTFQTHFFPGKRYNLIKHKSFTD